MTDDRDVQLVLDAYTAYGRGDIEAAVADMADDIVWIEPDTFPDGGRHDGRAAVARYLSASYAGWRELHSEPTATRRGDRIVVVHHAHGVRVDGTSNEMTVADVYTVLDGKVVHMQAYADPAAVPA